MQEKNQDSLKRAYATIQALRSNIDAITTVYGGKEIYVAEYHSALQMLEGIGIDVAHFQICSSEVQPRVVQGITVSYPGEAARPKKYTRDRYIDKGLLLTKLDTILMYFDLTHSDEPRRIGFTPPDK
jgi:hypothetical protein